METTKTVALGASSVGRSHLLLWCPQGPSSSSDLSLTTRRMGQAFPSVMKSSSGVSDFHKNKSD